MTRACGDCQLCCRLLPVVEGIKIDGQILPGHFNKPGGQRCQHQRHHKGCAVYRKSGMPMSCSLWNCAWLVGDDTGDLRRPDRSHYVIDIMPDFITFQPGEGTEPITVPVVQIWLDPNYPDAHRDPALRAYLAKRGEQGTAALIRLDSQRAFALIPPTLAADGEWHEVVSNRDPEGQHSAAAIREVLEASS